MNTKGKGKGKSKRRNFKAKSKAVIAMTLAVVMFASIFAGIGASAVVGADTDADADNKMVDGSVNDGVSVSVKSHVVDNRVSPKGMAGTISVERGTQSPHENIDNKTHQNESILQLKFTATGETIEINNLTVKQIGGIPEENLTNISVWIDVNEDGRWNDGDKHKGHKNHTIRNNTNLTIVTPTLEVIPGTPVYVIICVNTTPFPLGKSIQINLTSFNATGMMSGKSAKEVWVTPAPISSHEIFGIGNLTISRGAKDVEPRHVDAGVNTTVLMQLNFTAGIEGSMLHNITINENGTAHGVNDISEIFLVNDTNRDGNWTDDEPIVTDRKQFNADNGSVLLSFTPQQQMKLNINHTFLIIANTTKTFWSGETLAVNVTDFNAVGSESRKIVSKEGIPLSSNITTGQARINVTLGDRQPVYRFIPAGDIHVNMEITQFNFTVFAGEVNITHITLQANPTMESIDANNTWPRIWWDKNGDGLITQLINVTDSDVPLNVSGCFNLSKELHPWGVNVTLDPILTIGGNETAFGNPGFDSQNIIIAFNTTRELPDRNTTKIEINRTDVGFNFTAIDTTINKRIEDRSPSFAAHNLTASIAVESNPLWVSLHEDSPREGVEAGMHDEILVMVLNLTNVQPVIEPPLHPYPNIYIHSITVTENGTANETMIDAVALSIDGGNSVIASEEFKIDNSSVVLRPVEAIKIEPGESQKLSILVNTTEKFTIGNTLRFNISNPSLDINATAFDVIFGVTNHTTTEIPGHELPATGTIVASLGANTPQAGFVSAAVNTTFLPLMQLNFTAGAPENVIIHNITVTWNGTTGQNRGGINMTSSVGIVNDTDGDGIIDWEADERILNVTTFDEEGYAVLNLSQVGYLNVTKGTNVSVIIFVNTTSENITARDKLAINISNPRDHFNATGTVSNKRIFNPYTDPISSEVQEARDTGKILVDQLPLVRDTIIKNVTHNDVVMLRLNLRAVGEDINLTAMKIRGFEGINETNNVTGVALMTLPDENVISDRVDFTVDDGYVKLTVYPNLTIEAGRTKEVNVIANISTEKLSAGNEIILGLKPAMDLEAVGVFSGVSIQNTTIEPLKNITTVTGNVSVDFGLNNIREGPITARGVHDHNHTAILQLNFSAMYEPINITAINVTWLGCDNETANITVVAFNDTAGINYGVWDAKDRRLGEKVFEDGFANISFAPNLTVPEGSYKHMLICLNVTDNYNFTVGNRLQISVIDYIAVGTESSKTITPVHGVPRESHNLTGTGNITVIDTNLPKDAYILGGDKTVPVWQLNMSTNHENATLTSITLTFNGTANPITDISAVNLFHDANSNATVDAGDKWLASNDTFVDNRITLAPIEPFHINITEKKSLLVTVNTTAEFKAGETIAFNITVNTTAPLMQSPDVKATGVDSRIVMATNYTVPMSSNITTGFGSIDLYLGDVQPDDIYVTKTGNVSVMALNFSAIRGKIDIQNITVTWNGTADTNNIRNISIWKDDNDGVFEVDDDTLINITAFANQKTIETFTTEVRRNLTVEGVTNNVFVVVNITRPLKINDTLGFDVNQTLGVGYNATCNATGRVPHSTMQEVITGKISVEEAPPVPPEVWRMELKAGWNLVSVPKELGEAYDTAGELFNLVTGERIWHWNTTAKEWEPEIDMRNYTIRPGYGYWVFKLKDYTVTPEFKRFGADEIPPIISIPLVKGWNMIGHLDTEPENVSVALSTLIIEGYAQYRKLLWWNTTAGAFDICRVCPFGIPHANQDFDTLKPFKGYWIWMAEPGIYA